MVQQAVGLLVVVTNPGSSCLELPLGVPEENKLENRKCCCCSTDLFMLKRLFCQNLVAEWYFSPNVAVRLVVNSFGFTVQMQTVKRYSSLLTSTTPAKEQWRSFWALAIVSHNPARLTRWHCKGFQSFRCASKHLSAASNNEVNFFLWSLTVHDESFTGCWPRCWEMAQRR